MDGTRELMAEFSNKKVQLTLNTSLNCTGPLISKIVSSVVLHGL